VNLILFGPPGAGKGTQGDYLVRDLDLHKISTGDLLRIEVSKKSILGNKIKSTIDNGQLVSDDIINNLIESVVSTKKYSNRLIFDGYPRTLNQAKSLDLLLNKYDEKISCVLSLKVDKDAIIKRIIGRQICKKCGLIFNEYYYPSTKSNHSCGPEYLEKRADDNEKTIKNRFETYSKETFPLIKYYGKQNLLKEVDGMQEIDEIYKKIRQIIAS